MVEREPAMAEENAADCVVVGAGPVGLAAAAALAAVGREVVLVSAGREAAAADDTTSGATAGATAGATPRRRTPADGRTAALFPASIALLQRLGAWDLLADDCAALRAIRIVDATGELLRAPELLFAAGDIGWPRLGFNVPQAALARALWSCIERSGVHVAAGGPAVALQLDPARATLTLADGTSIRARLVIAADGRNSLCRAAVGIAVRRWSYPQTAIVSHFKHGRAHDGISTELHTDAGPCTTVPLPGHASSLVWVERPEAAERIKQLADGDFLAALDARLGGLLGTVTQPGPRQSFALGGLAAETLARRRVALVGEAGHVIPPIGAQGLNLGLFDVAVLADGVAAAGDKGADSGGDATLSAYAAARRGDIERRMGAVDIVNRMLISGMFPLSLARGAGLHLIAASPALRRRLIREGLQPADPLPSLMRG